MTAQDNQTWGHFLDQQLNSELYPIYNMLSTKTLAIAALAALARLSAALPAADKMNSCSSDADCGQSEICVSASGASAPSVAVMYCETITKAKRKDLCEPSTNEGCWEGTYCEMHLGVSSCVPIDD